MTSMALLARFWREGLIGLLVAALAITLAFMSARIEKRERERDAAYAARDLETAKHSVTRQSVATLQIALAAKNAESERRAKAYADTKAADARDVREADARYAAEAGRRAALERLSKVPASQGQCVAPKALTDALAGL